MKKINLDTLSPPTFLDLYAGCGGLSLGLMQAGWQGLFAIEKHAFAFETLQQNLVDCVPPWKFRWPEWLPVAPIDILDFKERYRSHLIELKGKVTLVAGGPPCQGYSFAGRRDPNDNRNKLVDAYLEIVEIIQPDLVLLENVEGMTVAFKDSEQEFAEMDDELISAAEEIKRVLNKKYYIFDDVVVASAYGVPQNRPRYMLIGVKRELSSKSSNPFLTINKNCKDFLLNKGLPIDRKITVGEAISDLLMEHGTVPSLEFPGFQEGIYGDLNGSYSQLMRITRDGLTIGNETKLRPDSHRFVNHKESTIMKFEQIMELAYGKHLSQSDRDALGIKKNTTGVLSKSRPSFTLTTLPDDRIHYEEPRILTVREYARLQSFPDWFAFKGNYTTGGRARKNDVPRYTQVGNAVPPLMAEVFGEGLKEYYKALLSK